MIVAFAYCDVVRELSPTYHACIPGLVNSLTLALNKPRIVHVTDQHTAGAEECEVFRVARPDDHIMTWRLQAQAAAHQLGPEILFTEPDVRFFRDVSEVWAESFDIAITGREHGGTFKGRQLLHIAPWTQGCVFSRSPIFWQEAAAHCATLGRKNQLWFGDMLSIAHMIRGGKFKVLELDAATYNHIPYEPGERSQAKVVHYKGERKNWLFKQVTEAA